MIHRRKIKFLKDSHKFLGTDILFYKKKISRRLFEIRFHFEPGIKLTKTLDKKSILIEVSNSGWRFWCDNFPINIESGLYFGNKNVYKENQNIFISGEINNIEENIKWGFEKV